MALIEKINDCVSVFEYRLSSVYRQGSDLSSRIALLANGKMKELRVSEAKVSPGRVSHYTYARPKKIEVVTIGAGPTGLAFACLLKALRPETGIAVIEKRERSVRDFGLKVNAFFPAIRCLKALPNSQKKILGVEDLIAALMKWQKKKFARTAEIEDTLTSIAGRLGVAVFKGKEFGVESPEALQQALDNPDGGSKLHELLKNATVVVGADGARSITRDFIGAKKSHEVALNWMAQLKYDVRLKAHRNGIEKIFYFVVEKLGLLQIHGKSILPVVFSKGKGHSNNAYQPATAQVFVPKALADALIQESNGQVIKGDSAHAWTFDEIKERVDTHPELKPAYDVFARILDRDERSGGMPRAAKVSMLPIGIYRCDKAVATLSGRQFALVGDAYAGLALQRGANNGQQSALLLAKEVKRLLDKDCQDLSQYEKDVETLTRREQSIVHVKAKGINVFSYVLEHVGPVMNALGIKMRLRKREIESKLSWSA